MTKASLNKLKRELDAAQQKRVRPGAILWQADYLFGADVDLPGAGVPGMWRWGSRLMNDEEAEELAKTHDVIRIVEVRQ